MKDMNELEYMGLAFATLLVIFFLILVFQSAS